MAPDADSAWTDCDEVSYELPDGSELTIGSERFRCLEALFRPALLGMEVGCTYYGHACYGHTYYALLGMEVGGVHELVRDCIEACAVDTRRQLYSAIVLAGGSAARPNARRGSARARLLRLASPGRAWWLRAGRHSRGKGWWVGCSGVRASHLHSHTAEWTCL